MILSVSCNIAISLPLQLAAVLTETGDNCLHDAVTQDHLVLVLVRQRQQEVGDMEVGCWQNFQTLFFFML